MHPNCSTISHSKGITAEDLDGSLEARSLSLSLAELMKDARELDRAMREQARISLLAIVFSVEKVREDEKKKGKLFDF
jgi:acetate kinase